jgi:predicted transcriptional regulator of viral defense system
MTRSFTQAQWLDQLRRGKSIYQFAELRRLTKLSEVATQRAVHRLARTRLIAKLGKGYYANLLQPPLIEEVSAVLYPPSYISLESALFHHGIIEQAPHMVTCVSTNKTKTFQTAFGEIHYARVHPKLFFGYELSGRSLLALPEKAALDFIYLQLQNGHTPSLDEWHWDGISTKKLHEFSEKFPRTVQRCLGEI